MDIFLTLKTNITKIEVTDKNTSKPFPKLMINTEENRKTIILAYACDDTEFHGTCIYIQPIQGLM